MRKRRVWKQIRRRSRQLSYQEEADPCASWERTQEDGRPKASRRRKAKFDGACYNCGKAKAKVNRHAKSEHGYIRRILPLQQRLQWRRQVRDRVRFTARNLFCLNSSKFGAQTEETRDEIPHVEQHGTSERKMKAIYTIGDATDISVQKHDFQVEGVVDEQGQENEHTKSRS